MIEVFEALKEEKRARHEANWNKNISKLLELKEKYNLQFTTKGNAVIIRDSRLLVNVDFYPHTNKWKNCKTNKYISDANSMFKLFETHLKKSGLQ